MTARLRYLVVTAARTRAPLAPVAATILALIGVYAYVPNEVGATWGLTAVLSCGLSAWAAGALLGAEPEAQADMAAVALGGRAGRTRLEAELAVAVAAVLSAAFVAYPLLLGAIGRIDVFDRTVRAGDVAAALIGHFTCGVLGAAVAVLFGPPRLRRRASSIAAVTAALLVLAASGAVAGPVAVADALSDAAAGTVPGGLAWPATSCLGLAAAAFAAALAWARRCD